MWYGISWVLHPWEQPKIRCMWCSSSSPSKEVNLVSLHSSWNCMKSHSAVIRTVIAHLTRVASEGILLCLLFNYYSLLNSLAHWLYSSLWKFVLVLLYVAHTFVCRSSFNGLLLCICTGNVHWRKDMASTSVYMYIVNRNVQINSILAWLYYFPR